MKTTLELSEKLLREAKKYAAQNGMTLKAVVETALRSLLEPRQRRTKFTLKKASFRGEGMQEDVREGDWSSARDVIYKGRGT